MRKKKTCALAPKLANGKDSRLYTDMLTKKGVERPVANYIYAQYLTGVDKAMDAARTRSGEPKYYRDPISGEHKAADVLKMVEYDRYIHELGDVRSSERTAGAKDNMGNIIDYQNAEDALRHANDFNDQSKAYVAVVNQHGDVFNVELLRRDAKTQHYVVTVRERMKAWELAQQAFNAVGIDLTQMPQELSGTINAFNTGLVSYIDGLSEISPQYLYKRGALLLFHLDPNSAEVQRLVNRWGSIEKAAQAIDDFNNNRIPMLTADKTLLMRAIRKCQQMRGLDIKGLKDQIQQMVDDVQQNSEETNIKKTIDDLHKKYKINSTEILKVDEKIKSWRDAAMEVAMLMQRELREAQRSGDLQKEKEMQNKIKHLMREIDSNRAYTGLLDFLSIASQEIKGDPSLGVLGLEKMAEEYNRQLTPDPIERAFNQARILQDMKNIITKYTFILVGLKKDTTQVNESVAQVDIDRVKEGAKDLLSIVEKWTDAIDKMETETFGDIVKQIIGKGGKELRVPSGQTLDSLITMAAADLGKNDFLYSMGRSSNPLVAAMGTIIRKAQDKRNEPMVEFARRIRIEDDKLQKAGFTSEFIYEDNGHIISDIDWDLFGKARSAAIGNFHLQGLKGFALKEELAAWEEQNTKEIVVDKKSGRTERVPDDRYRKPFPQLEPAQLEYYNAMMQIKGEIGTYLPEYAQHHYLPPQLRRNTVDTIAKGEIKKAVKNKVQDIYTIREDDTDFRMNGILEGRDAQIVNSGNDNTQLREIPIFYVRKLEDQEELLKDFSSGLQALANTALNYAMMHEIADVIEFMGDKIKHMSAGGTSKVDMVDDAEVRLLHSVYEWGKVNHNTCKMMDAWIAQHLYGQKIDPNTWGYKWAKQIKALIGYTSFKGLSTNWLGAVANTLVGEFQMLIEAGAGEFYTYADYAWANGVLFGIGDGKGSIGREGIELIFSNNIKSKAALLAQKFDPKQETFSDLGHQRYHSSFFRKMIRHDCSMIGYGAGEHLIYYVGMYAVLHHEKVWLNGKQITLYDALDVGNIENNNGELVIKEGVTADKEGLIPITIDGQYIEEIKGKIRYVNQNCHGAMNEEDKGIIHQHLWGRAVMNFRQWMVEHYSRRFRKRHWDFSLGEWREGYWVSLAKLLLNEDTRYMFKEGYIPKGIYYFLKDLVSFALRAESQWTTLEEDQKKNVKRVWSELVMFLALCGLEMALGPSDEHKNESFRRFMIYQVKRLITEEGATIPNPKIIKQFTTILQAPVAATNTINGFGYMIWGIGDLISGERLQRGPDKGMLKYWRNVLKYNLPGWKDYKKFITFDEDESLFKVFDNDSPNR